MYFSEDTDRAVVSFEDAQSKWEASANALKRLKTRRDDSRNAKTVLGKLWARHVTLPALEDRIATAEKDMTRARDRMIDHAETALLKMGREVMDGDEELRGKYADLWDDFEQTRFFARLGERLEKTATAVGDALHAMAESDVYLSPGQTPRQIMSLAEARDSVYDANEEIITLQYLMNDRGGQNETVNALMEDASSDPALKKAVETLMHVDPGSAGLSSPQEVADKAGMLRDINNHVMRLQGYFGHRCADAAGKHDEKARTVQKAFLMDAVARAAATMPEHKDLPQKLANALGMAGRSRAPKVKPRMASPAMG